VRLTGQQAKAQRLCHASLSTEYIEFAASIEKMKIDRSLRKAKYQPDFPAGFTRRYPF
jgi:hypothetical protein